MTTQLEAYKSFNPGDLITAEDANTVQTQIREEIQDKVDAVQNDLNAFKASEINATTLNNKTDDQLRQEFDQRYALQDHSHEGVRRYQLYFLELETVLAGDILQPAVIMHRMKRHPVVQVYHLATLPLGSSSSGQPGEQYKFCIAGPEHSQDPEAANFKTRSSDDRHWGDQFDRLVETLISNANPKKVAEIEGKFQDNYTLNAWINNLEHYLFEPGPSAYHFDAGDVHRTSWVAQKQDTPVKELKAKGEWPPRFVYRPQLINGPLSLSLGKPAVEVKFDINVFHLNPDEVEIAPTGSLTNFPTGFKKELHFMVILRS